MNLIEFATSPLSLLPPIMALGLAILTRRVLLSLGIGIVVGAFLLADYSIGKTITYIITTVKGVFIEDGGINTWNMSIVAFVVVRNDDGIINFIWRHKSVRSLGSS